MPDLNALLEFSQTHCIGICAVLVPANLLATLQTMLFVGFHRSVPQVQTMAIVASLYAIVLILHVLAWLVVGVVMAPTFILTFLGCLCLGINGWCVTIALNRRSLASLSGEAG